MESARMEKRGAVAIYSVDPASGVCFEKTMSKHSTYEIRT